ncbi:phosphoribosylaminoimidazole carboxylase, partial [Lactobacillus salivarius]|nr:phosphoribosylaminoimidazole carboxylase [Ligilactobacillus salivarius]
MGNEVLFPGDTLGIIGDSSNGIILAQTAKRLGFKVIVYATNEGSPTLADADVKIVGDFSD